MVYSFNNNFLMQGKSTANLCTCNLLIKQTQVSNISYKADAHFSNL